MANLLWAKVYYKDAFAGILQEESGNRTSFTYDASYLNSDHPAIAFTLPMQEAAHTYENGLIPFFDNLVAEGWLESAQTRLLGKRTVSRFALLMTFGFDCAGAVSVIDPEELTLTNKMLDMSDAKEVATITNRASLSGVQPKLTLIKKGNEFMPTGINMLSTHIAKFPSRGHDDLVVNEFLTTLAFNALLPSDDIVNLNIGEVKGFDEPALIIERFDREEGERIHFEELNQLLDNAAIRKYEGTYASIAGFIREAQGGQITDVYRLYGRILAGILLGNTDMHLKNFALFNDGNRFMLTPSYDQVAAAIYNYKTMALKMSGSRDLPIGDIKARQIVMLGNEFQLPKAAIDMIAKQLEKNLTNAKDVIAEASIGDREFKNTLIKMVDKRWNGTFALIGKALSK